MNVSDLPTPALVLDAPALEHNLATMAAARPGLSLRPHVKAHKCTALARLQRSHGHTAFTAATVREVVGLVSAGLGDDVLLANECVDPQRLAAAAACGGRITVAVDSRETVAAARAAGITEVLVDIDVGLPRCGCPPERAGSIADAARSAGLLVRGVMGYEGHAVGIADRTERARLTAESMDLLRVAHEAVGGDVISAGGTGTYALNTLATEIQAGSYVALDTSYETVVPEFELAASVVGTVISVAGERAVADVGIKALGMDHGNPRIDDGEVWFCSDEHVTYSPRRPAKVGDRVVVRPAHIDPTFAKHERVWLASEAHPDAEVLDDWAIDLRGW